MDRNQPVDHKHTVGSSHGNKKGVTSHPSSQASAETPASQ